MDRRRILGLTQRQVGEAVGVTSRAVQSWESGEHIPRLSPVRMARLCEVLKCTIQELASDFQFDEVGSPPGPTARGLDETP